MTGFDSQCPTNSLVTPAYGLTILLNMDSRQPLPHINEKFDISHSQAKQKRKLPLFSKMIILKWLQMSLITVSACFSPPSLSQLERYKRQTLEVPNSKGNCQARCLDLKGFRIPSVQAHLCPYWFVTPGVPWWNLKLVLNITKRDPRKFCYKCSRS